MVSPQVPGSRPIRQAVLDHQSHRQGDDTAGIEAVGGGQVRQVDVEVPATTGTAMLRIGDNQIPRAVGGQIAQVMQSPGEDLVPICHMSTPRALAPWEASRSANDLRLRQILNTRDSFSRFSGVFTRSSHPEYLLEDSVPPVTSSAQDLTNLQLIPVMLLQCLIRRGLRMADICTLRPFPCVVMGSGL